MTPPGHVRFALAVTFQPGLEDRRQAGSQGGQEWACLHARFAHTIEHGGRRAHVYLGKDGAWHLDCFVNGAWHDSTVRGGQRAHEETVEDACAFVNDTARRRA